MDRGWVRGRWFPLLVVALLAGPSLGWGSEGRDMSIANMRQSYHRGQLPSTAVRGAHPLVLFSDSVVSAARLHKLVEAQHPSLLAPAKRLILGTVDQHTGRPAATVATLDSLTAAELVVTVDPASPALRHLATDGHVALVFHSQGTQRQIRVVGTARVDSQEPGQPISRAGLILPGGSQGSPGRWSAEDVKRKLVAVAQAYGQANVAGLPALDPNAMCVVTARRGEDRVYVPSARMVLLKGCEPEGPVFYTNFRSPKGQDLEANPQAAFVLDWPIVGQRLDLAGSVGKVSDEAADAYWGTRPYASQLGSAASRQSQPLSWRGELVARALLYGLLHGPWPRRPKHWGGFQMEPDLVQWSSAKAGGEGSQVRLVIDPTLVEAWQGRDSRLHDRWLWLRGEDGNWSQPERLFP
jgi:pyridoxamine 5'-phosphate oxidase